MPEDMSRYQYVSVNPDTEVDLSRVKETLKRIRAYASVPDMDPEEFNKELDRVQQTQHIPDMDAGNIRYLYPSDDVIWPTVHPNNRCEFPETGYIRWHEKAIPMNTDEIPFDTTYPPYHFIPEAPYHFIPEATYPTRYGTQHIPEPETELYKQVKDLREKLEILQWEMIDALAIVRITRASARVIRATSNVVKAWIKEKRNAGKG